MYEGGQTFSIIAASLVNTRGQNQGMEIARPPTTVPATTPIDSNCLSSFRACTTTDSPIKKKY